MTMALVISGVMAWWFGNDMNKLHYLINFETGSHTILGWVVMFAPLGLVFVMGGMVNKMSGTMLLATFLVFSTIMGISLSYIFLIYSRRAPSSTCSSSPRPCSASWPWRATPRRPTSPNWAAS